MSGDKISDLPLTEEMEGDAKIASTVLNNKQDGLRLVIATTILFILLNNPLVDNLKTDRWLLMAIKTMVFVVSIYILFSYDK